MMTGKILMAGCGALGSRIAMELGGLNMEFMLVDDDVVEPENIGTSAYTEEYISVPKTTALATMMWLEHTAAAVSWHRTVDSLLLSSYEEDALVIDTFDNFKSRVQTRGPNTLHVGVNVDRIGAIEWDENYTIPASGTWTPRGENPVCTHDLGVKILEFTALQAADVVRDYLVAGIRRTAFVKEDGSLI